MSLALGEMERRRMPVEIREDVIASRAHWWAGVFEIAGSMRFKGTDPSPYVSYTDAQQRILILLKLFGGKSYPQTQTDSVSWELYGANAVALSQVMKPFAPSRREIITAFENWEQTSDHEARRELALEVQQFDRFSTVQPANFAHLVQNREIVAGIIDARSLFLAHGGGLLETKSKNTALLSALHDTYGGSLPLQGSKGSSHLFGERIITMKHDYYAWQLGGEKLYTLLEEVQPFLILRQHECEQMLSKALAAA